MSLAEKMSGVRPPNSKTQGESDVIEKRPTDRLESGLEHETLEFEEESPCGSMALGKQRHADTPLAIEPEKHLSPRATSKEFTFPKSN